MDAASPPPIPDLLSHPTLQPLGLYIQPLYRVLICGACQSAILHTSVPRHFSDMHKDVPHMHINMNDIIALGSQYGLRDTLPQIVGPVVQINGLPLLSGCQKCPECSAIYSSSSLPVHFSTKHAGMPTPPFRELPLICAQQLNKGSHKTLFEVIVPTQPPPYPPTHQTIEYLRTSRDHQVAEYFKDALDARAVNPWMEYTGWHLHVKPYKTFDLCKLVLKPKKEGVLDKLVVAVRSLFDVGYKCIDNTNTIVLQQLKSDDLNECVVNMPFRKLQEGTTRVQYETVLVQFLAMLLRPKGDYTLPLPEKIQHTINQLQAELDNGPNNERQITNKASDVLFRLWARTWKKSELNSIGDPTICFLALSMLKSDSSFQTPRNTTPFISKLKYGIRIIMLAAIKRAADARGIDDIAACTLYEEWFTEKKDSTFNTLCTLQHYASSLAYNEPTMPRIVWTDRSAFRTMRYKGNTIEFDKLSTVFTNLEQHAIQLWKKDILLGLPLHISYDRIVDDISNNSVGYSFITDPRNSCFKNRDILATAILSSPTLSKQFLTGHLDEKGQPIWKVTELQKWLFSYSRLHEVQITSTDMKGDSPCRGTEMACIEYQNSATRIRGLYMIGNHLTIMCQYHKSAAITARDKVIPHSLDAVTSDLMIQDLAIARPFAELAAYICYSHDMNSQHRYHSYLFVNNKELFETTQLTQALKTYTLPVFEVGLGVNDWRHISAAFRRKICPAMENLMEEDASLESISALQSGHSRQTENQLYGISTAALAGASEDVLPLFIDASTDWQVACKVVPGGHMLPYWKATSNFFLQLAAEKKIKANYVRPIQTVEQVMDQMVTVFNKQLENHTCTLIAQIEQKMETLLESKLSQMLDKVLDKVGPALHSQPGDPASSLSNNSASLSLTSSLLQPSHGPSTSMPSSQPEEKDDIEATNNTNNSDNKKKEKEQEQEDANDIYVEDDFANPAIWDALEQSMQGVSISQHLSAVNTSGDQTISPTDEIDSFTASPEITDSIQSFTDASDDQLEQKALSLLRKYTKKSDAIWTSGLQWQAIRQIYQREEDVIVIAATGSGKTMTGLVPTLMGSNDEISIIVLPLVSLITDYKRKLESMNIPYHHFTTKSTSINGCPKFIIVSADLTTSPQWAQFVGKIAADYDLSRLIFDESQIPITSTDYRKVMRYLDQIRIWSFQMVLLTGTCPPHSENQMMKLFGLEAASTVIFRGRTDRPELQYIIKPRHSTAPNAMKLLDSVIGEYRETCRPQDRVMVFVPFVTNGNVLSRHYNCDFYCSQPGEDDENHKDYLRTKAKKEKMYLDWFHGNVHSDGRKDIIVATTALSAGNDYPSVRLVIHFNTPIEMVSYIQEVSRGGRDGQPCKCILIPINDKQPLPIAADDVDHKGIHSMHHYVYQETECLRYAITSFADGVGVYCHNDRKRQKCSLCATKKPNKSAHHSEHQLIPIKPNPSLKRKQPTPGGRSAFIPQMQAALNRKRIREEETLAYISRFQNALAIFNASCAYCTLKNPMAKHHTLTGCSKFTNLWPNYKMWKNNIKYGAKFPNKSCFFCHIPRIGNLPHREIGSAEDCSHPDVVPPVAYTIFLDRELHAQAEQHFGAKWKSVEDYAKWLADLPSDKHLTRISAIFLWYMKTYFNIK